MPSPARVRVVVVSMLAALAAGPAGRRAADQAPGGERAPGLIVDFVAVQADGTPVADLQSSEVEVRLNDRVRMVRSLRRVATAPAPAPGRRSVAQGGASEGGRVPAPFGTNDSVVTGRSFVLVVDQESFGAGGEQLLRNAVEGLLTELTPADHTMIAALPFGGVKLPFTSDHARIRLAMAGLSGRGSRNETGSELACRTRQFLESLDGFLPDRAGAGSPLTVVLFTAGMAAPRRDAPMALAPGMCELLVNQFRRVSAAASAVRANFYVVQPADIGMAASAWRESIGGGGSLGSDHPLEGIEHLAGATGAARLPLDATGSGALTRVARASSAYYEAELEPERGDVLSRSRTLHVRTARRGITLRARPEITFAETRRPAATRIAVPDLLASTDAFTELRLRVGGFTVRDPDGRLRIGVVVEPVEPAASLTSVGAVLIAPDGRVAGQWFGRDPAERPLLGAMSAPPGTYRLRVAAVDAVGRAGAAEDVLDAGLTAVGPRSLGSLLIGLSRPERLTLQLQFGAEPTAIASFDIYGGMPGLRMAATLEVAREAEAAPLVTVPLALARADDSRVVAKGAVPLGALPPGDYVIRGVIRLEDGTIGRVVRTLRKVAR